MDWKAFNHIKKLASTVNYLGNLNVTVQDHMQPINVSHDNPIHGAEMAVDASFSGDATVMYAENLGPPNEYTASAVVGTGWNFDSTAPNPVHSGLKSIEAVSVEDGDIFQLDNGSCPDCIAITGFIHITKWSEAKGNHLALHSWDTAGQQMQGTEVFIDNYITVTEFGAWQKFSIPITDLGITGSQSDAYRFRVDSFTGEQNAPDFYLDDISLRTEGGGIEYIAAPPPGLRFHADYITTVTTFTPEGFYASGEPYIDPDKFFILPFLEGGILNTVQLNGVLINAINVRTIGLYMHQVAEMNPPSWIGNGVKCTYAIQIPFSTPFTFDSASGDFSRILLNDDFSSLDSMSIRMGGKFEPSL